MNMIRSTLHYYACVGDNNFTVYMWLRPHTIFCVIFTLWAHMLTEYWTVSSSTNPWSGPVCENFARVIGIGE